MATLFSDFLTAAGVRHTEAYSDKQFREMPFQTMYGLSNLMKQYGICNCGIRVEDSAKLQALKKLGKPFLADTADGFTIVTHTNENQITYESQHRVFTMPISEFVAAWNGIALVPHACEASCEPNYARHRVGEISKKVKLWLIYMLAAALLGFSMWQTGLYTSIASWAVIAFENIGIWLSWMLVLKSLGIHTKRADAVCSVLEEGGCDEIAKSEASSFMGIFKWSEVGLAYFSVSLLATLLFPHCLTALAAINILCLPYTIWSICYQKFVAKTWCTLCVYVQATLWLLFFSFLFGGWTKHILPVSGVILLDCIVLIMCYALALFSFNLLDDHLARLIKKNE